MKTILFPLITAAALLTGSVRAQNEYAEIARLRGLNKSVRGIRSMADGEHYTTLESNDIVRYSYASAAPGESMLPAPAPNLVITDYACSPDERSILIASGRKPIYRHLAAYGHMGREDLGVAWEKTDRTEELKKAVQG